MNYWWVNHKQTFKQENSGGYLWSPKRKASGENVFYTNMTRVSIGDLIISYASGDIKAIGIVTCPAVDAPEPKEFGNQWTNDGWQVKVEWITLKKPLRLKSYFNFLYKLFPDKYSPINSNGNGNQNCYLAAISKSYPQNKMLIENKIERVIIENSIEKSIFEQSIESTMKERLVLSRIGQGYFKDNLIKYEKKCRITGVDDPRFLIASHIKPWRLSNNDERLDWNNGLLLSPHIDKLFDNNFISFSNDGNIRIYNRIANPILEKWKIDITINVGSFNDSQKIYLEYHRKLCSELNQQLLLERMIYFHTVSSINPEL